MATRYVPVQGTDSWVNVPVAGSAKVPAAQWWQNGSVFNTRLAAQGVELLCPDDPFQWDSNLSGTFFTHTDRREWQAAGLALRQYFDRANVPLCDRNVVAHSHGLQVVMYACAFGLKLRNLVTVCGPVRADMTQVTKLARTRIGYWLAISDPGDPIQAAGELFDGPLHRPVALNPYADVNDSVPGITHTGPVYAESVLPLWASRGWAAALTREAK